MSALLATSLDPQFYTLLTLLKEGFDFDPKRYTWDPRWGADLARYGLTALDKRAERYLLNRGYHPYGDLDRPLWAARLARGISVGIGRRVIHLRNRGQWALYEYHGSASERNWEAHCREVQASTPSNQRFMDFTGWGRD